MLVGPPVLDPEQAVSPTLCNVVAAFNGEDGQKWRLSTRQIIQRKYEHREVHLHWVREFDEATSKVTMNVRDGERLQPDKVVISYSHAGTLDGSI